MYSSASRDSSLRRSPTKPISALGSMVKAASSIPSPARRTGTMRGTGSIRVPLAGASGVWTSNDVVGRSRVAS